MPTSPDHRRVPGTRPGNRPRPRRPRLVAYRRRTFRGRPRRRDATDLPGVTAIPGDVTDPPTAPRLAAAVQRLAAASTCWSTTPARSGRARCRRCADYPLDALRPSTRSTSSAPLALIQRWPPAGSAAGGAIVNVSSDAAVEAYPGWGGYGAAKAALDQLTAVLAAEQPGAARATPFDPGDLRTDMHQQAFPGEDISDRPEPESACRLLLRPDRPASRRAAAAGPAGDRDPAADGARRSTRLCPARRSKPPPPRAGLARYGVRLLVAHRGWPVIDPALQRPAPPPRPRRRAGGQHFGDPACRRRGRRATAAGRDRALLDPPARRACGWSSCGSPPARQPGRTRRPARRRAARRRAGSSWWPRSAAGPAAAGPAVGGPAGLRSPCSRLLGPSRPAHPLSMSRDLAHPALPERVRGQPGSAEMPSAARPFTAELITGWWRAAWRRPPVAPPGVPSPERHEPPFAERYRVRGHGTAGELARAAGGRVIAVGTTVVRALETVAEPGGIVTPGEGWTGLVIRPERPCARRRRPDHRLARATASHLALLAAIAGPRAARGVL